MNLGSPHQARKRFGQNFLVDDHVIRQILAAIKPRPDDNMVEIGPGQGAITAPLLDAVQQLHVIELDRDLIPRLQQQFIQHSGLHIHAADALQFDYGQLTSPGRPLRIVGNLPYNISTPLIFHLLSYQGGIADMHFMLQKEVVQRMAAGTGEKHYGRLGIMCQYYCQVEHLFDVGAESFDPAPKVESAIVRLSPHPSMPLQAHNLDLLDKVVKTAFQQRRKTLRNALKPLVADVQSLAPLKIDLGKRPENLSLADYVNLANFLQTEKPQLPHGNAP